MSIVSDSAISPMGTIGLFRKKRRLAFAFPAVILAYLVYIFFAFDILGLAEKARIDNARILIADSYSYKTHVTRDNRAGGLTIAKEGEDQGHMARG